MEEHLRHRGRAHAHTEGSGTPRRGRSRGASSPAAAALLGARHDMPHVLSPVTSRLQLMSPPTVLAVPSNPRWVGATLWPPGATLGGRPMVTPESNESPAVSGPQSPTCAPSLPSLLDL